MAAKKRQLPPALRENAARMSKGEIRPKRAGKKQPSKAAAKTKTKSGRANGKPRTRS